MLPIFIWFRLGLSINSFCYVKKSVTNEDVRAFKYALEKPKHTKEHIKKDSIRYFVEKFENYELMPKFKL